MNDQDTSGDRRWNKGGIAYLTLVDPSTNGDRCRDVVLTAARYQDGVIAFTLEHRDGGPVIGGSIVLLERQRSLLHGFTAPHPIHTPGGSS